MMAKQPRLYPATCPKCKQVLVHAPAGALAHCPNCRVWTMARPDTAKPVARRKAPTKETRAMQWEQLTLF